MPLPKELLPQSLNDEKLEESKNKIVKEKLKNNELKTTKKSSNWHWVATKLLPIFLFVILGATISIAAVPSWRASFNKFIAKWSPKAEYLVDDPSIFDDPNCKKITDQGDTDPYIKGRWMWDEIYSADEVLQSWDNDISYKDGSLPPGVEIIAPSSTLGASLYASNISSDRKSIANSISSVGINNYVYTASDTKKSYCSGHPVFTAMVVKIEKADTFNNLIFDQAILEQANIESEDNRKMLYEFVYMPFEGVPIRLTKNDKKVDEKPTSYETFKLSAKLKLSVGNYQGYVPWMKNEQGSFWNDSFTEICRIPGSITNFRIDGSNEISDSWIGDGQGKTIVESTVGSTLPTGYYALIPLVKYGPINTDPYEPYDPGKQIPGGNYLPGPNPLTTVGAVLTGSGIGVSLADTSILGSLANDEGQSGTNANWKSLRYAYREYGVGGCMMLEPNLGPNKEVYMYPDKGITTEVKLSNGPNDPATQQIYVTTMTDGRFAQSDPVEKVLKDNGRIAKNEFIPFFNSSRILAGFMYGDKPTDKPKTVNISIKLPFVGGGKEISLKYTAPKAEMMIDPKPFLKDTDFEEKEGNYIVNSDDIAKVTTKLYKTVDDKEIPTQVALKDFAFGLQLSDFDAGKKALVFVPTPDDKAKVKQDEDAINILRDYLQTINDKIDHLKDNPAPFPEVTEALTSGKTVGEILKKKVSDTESQISDKISKSYIYNLPADKWWEIDNRHPSWLWWIDQNNISKRIYSDNIEHTVKDDKGNDITNQKYAEAIFYVKGKDEGASKIDLKPGTTAKINNKFTDLIPTKLTTTTEKGLKFVKESETSIEVKNICISPSEDQKKLWDELAVDIGMASAKPSKESWISKLISSTKEKLSSLFGLDEKAHSEDTSETCDDNIDKTDGKNVINVANIAKLNLRSVIKGPKNILDKYGKIFIKFTQPKGTKLNEKALLESAQKINNGAGNYVSYGGWTGDGRSIKIDITDKVKKDKDNPESVIESLLIEYEIAADIDDDFSLKFELIGEEGTSAKLQIIDSVMAANETQLAESKLIDFLANKFQNLPKVRIDHIERDVNDDGKIEILKSPLDEEGNLISGIPENDPEYLSKNNYFDIYYDNQDKKLKEKVFSGDKVFYIAKFKNEGSKDLYNIDLGMKVTWQADSFMCSDGSCGKQYSFDNNKKILWRNYDKISTGGEKVETYWVKLKDKISWDANSIGTWVNVGRAKYKYIFLGNIPVPTIEEYIKSEDVYVKNNLFGFMIGILKGPNNPVPGAMVELLRPGNNEVLSGIKNGTKDYYTDKDGKFVLEYNRNDLKPGEKSVKFKISYFNSDKKTPTEDVNIAFFNYDAAKKPNDIGEPLYFETDPVNLSESRITYARGSDQKSDEEISVRDDPNPRWTYPTNTELKDKTIAASEIYYNMFNARNIFKDELDEDMKSIKVVFTANDEYGAYFGNKGTIELNKKAWKNFKSPGFKRSPAVELHELSHLFMHRNLEFGDYSTDFAEDKIPNKKVDTNHGGFINDSSRDSIGEGFADFMGIWLNRKLDKSFTSWEKISSDYKVYANLEVLYPVSYFQKPIKHSMIYQNVSQERLEGEATGEILKELTTGTPDSYLGKKYPWTENYGSFQVPFRSVTDIKGVVDILKKNKTRTLGQLYDILTKSYEKNSIDNLFLYHGVFTDANCNMSYDTGEIIGRPGNDFGFRYQNTNDSTKKMDIGARGAREFPPPLEGANIKINLKDLSENSVGSATVKVKYTFESPYESFNYEDTMPVNNNDSLYVAFPYDVYRTKATITIEGSNDVYEFDSSKYWEAINSGMFEYFAEKTFTIGGTTPPAPNDTPVTIVPVNEEGKNISSIGGGNSVVVESSGFNESSQAKVTVGKSELGTVPILADKFGLKIDIPENIPLGKSNIKITGENGEEASAGIWITHNNWFNKNTIALALIIVFAIFLLIWIIHVFTQNQHLISKHIVTIGDTQPPSNTMIIFLILSAAVMCCINIPSITKALNQRENDSLNKDTRENINHFIRLPKSSIDLYERKNAEPVEQWGKPETICFIERLSYEWNQKYPEDKLLIGRIDLPDDKQFEKWTDSKNLVDKDATHKGGLVFNVSNKDNNSLLPWIWYNAPNPVGKASSWKEWGYWPGDIGNDVNVNYDAEIISPVDGTLSSGDKFGNSGMGNKMTIETSSDYPYDIYFNHITTLKVTEGKPVEEGKTVLGNITVPWGGTIHLHWGIKPKNIEDFKNSGWGLLIGQQGADWINPHKFWFNGSFDKLSGSDNGGNFRLFKKNTDYNLQKTNEFVSLVNELINDDFKEVIGLKDIRFPGRSMPGTVFDMSNIGEIQIELNSK